MARQIDTETHDLDPRLVDVAMRCGPHSAVVLAALISGDWSEVDALPELDLTGQVDVRMVA
jgi:hypothetical protein